MCKRLCTICMLIIITIISICATACSDSNNNNQSAIKEPTITYVYSNNISTNIVQKSEFSTSKNKLIEIMHNSVDRFKTMCLDQCGTIFETNWKSKDCIVIGRFELYSNISEFNFVCFSSYFKIYIKDNDSWKVNHYLLYLTSYDSLRFDLLCMSNLEDTSKMSLNLNDLAYDCLDYNSNFNNILKTECANTQLFSSWNILSNENWYYRVQNERYWTCVLDHVII